MPPVQTRLPTTSSSPTSPFAHPRSSMSPVSSPASSMRPPPAPYMVALSGWPEPVYISNGSRPTTPRPMFPGEVSDGIPNLPLSPPHKPIQHSPAQAHVRPKAGKEGVGGVALSETKSSKLSSSSRHPSHVHSHHHPHQLAKDNHPFPTSSTRTPTHSPPPPSVPYPYGGMTLNRHSTFRDPRLIPGVAVVHNKPLTVAPNWTSSSPPPPASPYSPLGSVANVGMKVPAGERGTGILVMRAVPDVYPPPVPSGMGGMAAGMTSLTKAPGPTTNGRHVGVATEVYPRDPDSAFLWGGAAGVPREPSVGTDEDMEADNQREW